MPRGQVIRSISLGLEAVRGMIIMLVCTLQWPKGGGDRKVFPPIIWLKAKTQQRGGGMKTHYSGTVNLGGVLKGGPGRGWSRLDQARAWGEPFPGTEKGRPFVICHGVVG